MVFNLFIFLFGLFVGSFLNCVIYRLEKKESFLKGRSYCPLCKHILGWYDLIPFLSYVFLLGECRYCHRKISIQYPLVELATGTLFALIFKFQFSWTPSGGLPEELLFNFQTIIGTCFLLIVSCFLIIIFVYDLKHYIIPDKVVFPAIGAVFLYNLILNQPFGESVSRPARFLVLNSLWAAIIAAGFFLFIFLVSRGKWLGFGDVKLVFLMGLILGFPNILAALFLAFFFGAIIGIGLIIFGKKKLKSEIPFGPFLVTGTFIAILWGKELITWYLSLIT